MGQLLTPVHKEAWTSKANIKPKISSSFTCSNKSVKVLKMLLWRGED